MTASDHPLDLINDMIRHGRIISVDGARAVVQLGEVVSPPLPWFAIVGAWLVWLPPSEGAQVTVLCPYGDITGGIIINGLYSTDFPAPGLGLLAALLKAPDGATFAYDAATHALTFQLPDNGTVTLIARGGFDLQGDVMITGKLETTGNATLGANLTVTGDTTLGDGAHQAVKLADGTPTTKVTAI